MDNNEPTHTTIEWGMVLDDRGSTSIYETEEEARTDSEKYGAPLVKVTVEYFAPTNPNTEF